MNSNFRRTALLTADSATNVNFPELSKIFLSKPFVYSSQQLLTAATEKSCA